MKVGKNVEAFNQFVSVVRENENMTGDIWDTKKENIVNVRRGLSVIGRDIFKLSFPKIGKCLGIRHSTVIHSIKRHNEFMQRTNKGGYFNPFYADCYFHILKTYKEKHLES